MAPTVHATAIALRRNGAWHGVLLRGPSGIGKSDLALQLIERGARLVADDRVCVWASQGALYARSPETIAGLIEVRGVGILPVAPLDCARVSIIVDLIQEVPERMPVADHDVLCAIAVPRLRLNPRPASSSTVVVRAIEAL